MRGATSAAPSGGLRVVASGSLAPASRWTTITLPAKALFVVVYRYIGKGYNTSIFVVQSNTMAAGEAVESEGEARFQLLEDGQTLKYFEEYAGATDTYYAYG